MKKSVEIETELNKVTKRLDELTETRDRLSANQQNLQKDFVDGKTPLDELQVEQSNLTALNESIKALQIKQNELHTAFQKASLSESSQTLLESATATALEAETLFSECLEARNELDNVIGEIIERFYGKLSSFHDKRREYLALSQKIGSNTKTPGVSNDLLMMLESNHLNFPPVKFGLSIQSAFQTIAVEKEKQEARSAKV